MPKIIKSESSWVSFWCPGCKCQHSIPVNSSPKDWTFDGNFESPTITPSLRVFAQNGKDTACHVVITKGVLNFCEDSAHELKGKSIPMEDR